MVSPVPLRTHPSRRRAFSLFEAVVAAAILGSSLAVILGLSADTLASQRRGELLETAASLADERLQLVLAVGPEAYPSLFTTGPCEPPFESFSHAVTLTPGAGGEPYDVSATITWLEGATPRSLTIHTRIAPRLGNDPNPDRAPQETTDRSSAS